MKNLFLMLAFMLAGTFAFANNVQEVKTVSLNEAIELVNSLDSVTTTTTTTKSYSVVEKGVVDCLLTITFQFRDGSSETIHVLVRGASCEEILG